MAKIVKPLPHQVAGIQHIENHNGRVLVADDMGLGKTVLALGCLYRNPEWLPAVVVCPAGLKYNWQHEAMKHFNVRASVCEGAEPPAGRSLTSHNQITVINYDILSPRKNKKTKKAGRSWVTYLRQQGFKTLIADECHAMQNNSSKRTKAMQALSLGKDHLIYMSGTPIVNRPMELWPVVSMLWPGVFDSFWEYV